MALATRTKVIAHAQPLEVQVIDAEACVATLVRRNSSSSGIATIVHSRAEIYSLVRRIVVICQFTFDADHLYIMNAMIGKHEAGYFGTGKISGKMDL